MAAKRIRVFAGPNGSGKTTIISELRSEIPYGIYVNADDIEKLLHESNILLFDSFNLNIEDSLIKDFFKKSTFSPAKRNEPNLWEHLKITNNVLHISCKSDSYLAADIAEFIRQQLLYNQVSFTFETVMSHENKLAFLNKAKTMGYRIYLYFLATEDPEINISRVNVRVAQKGHDVDIDKIKSRYYKSLQHLKAAIKLSNRAYLWDNSSQAAILFAEINEGKNVTIFDSENVPAWFINYVL